MPQADGSGLRLAECLCSVGAAPERSGIYTVGIAGEHPIVELARGLCFVVGSHEVLDVLPRFLDVPR